MKMIRLVFLFIAFLFCSMSFGQKTDSSKVQKYFKVEKNDGTIYLGKIISQDAREVLLETDKIGQVYIPKHEIKSISEVKVGDMDKNGNYIPEEIFSTRYFITTNALPMEKGENYILWNLYGPEFQFGVGKNFGVGIMTTWVGIPIVGSVKYSFNISEKFNLGLGGLFGTGSWAAPDFFVGLPYGVATLGDRRRNLNFSAGYGFFAINGNSEGRALLSVAGMTRIGKKASFVFDTFIIPSTKAGQIGGALILPGFRFQTDSKGAFQFGFGAIAFDGELVPVPIPIVSWFRKL